MPRLPQVLRGVLPPRPPFDDRRESSRQASNPIPSIGAGAVRRLLAITFLVGLAVLGTLGATAGSETVQLETSVSGKVEEIGTPGSPRFGGLIDQSHVRRLLRPGPARPSPESDPDSPPSGEELFSAHRRAPAWDLGRHARPLIHRSRSSPGWRRQLHPQSVRSAGRRPIHRSLRAARTSSSGRAIECTSTPRAGRRTRHQQTLCCSRPRDLSGGLFDPLIDPSGGGPKLGLKQNGQIDNFNDSRVVFDPYRKRFWAVATGFCRTNYGVDENGDGKADKCGFELLSPYGASFSHRTGRLGGREPHPRLVHLLVGRGSGLGERG